MREKSERQVLPVTSIDDMASEIMKGLQEYADLADTEVKKAVRKTATEVRKEISSNAPEDTGAYEKSWTAKKVSENSHSLQMTRYIPRTAISWLIYWSMVTPSVAVGVFQANRILLRLNRMAKNYWKI